MIQRIQSIFLLLAAVAAFLLFASPMSFFEVGKNSTENADSVLADGIFNIQDNIILMIMSILIGILALGTIFLYKNRKQQMTLSRIVVVVSLLLMAVVGVFFYLDYQELKAGTEVEGGFGLLSPILSLIFGILALRFIRKDEKIVRSMDRLR